MELADIESITISENRFRKEISEQELTELSWSIQDIGLLHLPILRDGKVLVSGERRYRAIKLLHEKKQKFKYLSNPIPTGQLPYAPFEGLDDLEAKEVELQENLLRVDLPWQDSVRYTKELHELRVAADPTWTRERTRAEIAPAGTTMRSETIRNRIALSENLHRPEVRAAKTEHAAIQVLRKSLGRELIDAQNKRQKKVKSKHTLIHGEAIVACAKLKTKFDVILTDPPFGIGADKHQHASKNATAAHEYDDSWATVGQMLTKLAFQSIETTKDQAHLYLMCAYVHYVEIAEWFSAAGWDVWPRPLIWYKGFGPVPSAEYGPMYTHEYILFANKGKKEVTGTYQDTISVPSLMIRNHAAEKPVELYTNLLKRSARPGDKVLDPFCGSGTIFPAAHRLNCTATGIDSSESSIAMSNKRIGELL